MKKPWYESFNKQIAITPIADWSEPQPVVVVHYYDEATHSVYDLRDHKYLVSGWKPASSKQIAELLHTNN